MHDERRHDPAASRALADPSRARVYEALRDEPDGTDASTLARRLGLHPNTVRWHLSTLVDTGLVHAATEHRGRPGRPRVVFRATRDDAGDGYRVLSGVLAAALLGSPGGADAAEAAGEAWGRILVAPRPPLADVDADAARAQLTALLEDGGFAPEEAGGGREIRLRRCPLLDAASSYGNVVCRAHLGMLRGAAATLGAPLAVEGLDPFAEPGVCRVRLAASFSNQ